MSSSRNSGHMGVISVDRSTGWLWECLVPLRLCSIIHLLYHLLWLVADAGVCLGMQCAVIEFARHVLHWQTASSTEVDPTTTHPVVCYITIWYKSFRCSIYGAIVVALTMARVCLIHATAAGSVSNSCRFLDQAVWLGLWLCRWCSFVTKFYTSSCISLCRWYVTCYSIFVVTGT